MRKKNWLWRLFGVIIPAFLAIALLSATIGNEIIQGLTPSLESFVIIQFMCYLFFITLPVEMLFLGYLFLGYNFIVLFVLAIVLAVSAQIIDYGIGYLLSDKVIGFLGKSPDFERKYKKTKKKIDKYGGWVIFLFNLVPASSPILLLTAGLVKYPFKKAIFLSAAGLILKYIIIIITYLVIV